MTNSGDQGETCDGVKPITRAFLVGGFSLIKVKKIDGSDRLDADFSECGTTLGYLNDGLQMS